MCWKGNLDLPETEEGGDACAIFTDPGTPNQFWSFGNGWVSTANINKYYDDLYGTYGYAVGWTQNYGGYSSYAVKNTTLSNPINLNTSGRDMQLHTGWDFTTMRGIALSTSSPYAFQLTSPIEQSGGGGGKELDKNTALQISTGRTGAVSANGANFYFTVGDINVNGEAIDFPELHDTIKITSDRQLFENLISKPFALSDASDFSYGVQYGVTDSIAAVSAVGDDHYVRFKVDLLDANTGEIIGTFDDVKYSALHIEKYNNIGYEVDTKGIGNRTVRLRLSISTTLSPEYSLGSVVSPGSAALSKNGTTKKQIDYKGTNVITDYALDQNYPNPFNPATTISFALPKDGVVTLKIYDALGREVQTLVNEFKSSGRYTAEFDASRLASGIYIYKLVSGDYSAVKKMMLVK